MKKYRVAGTFSYYPDGASDEKLKPVDVTVEADSKEEAAEVALEDYEHENQEPQWLVGYPSVEMLGFVYDGPPIKNYWLKHAR